MFEVMPENTAFAQPMSGLPPLAARSLERTNRLERITYSHAAGSCRRSCCCAPTVLATVPCVIGIPGSLFSCTLRPTEQGIDRDSHESRFLRVDVRPDTAACTIMGQDQSALVKKTMPRLAPAGHQDSSLYTISYIRGLVNRSIGVCGETQFAMWIMGQPD